MQSTLAELSHTSPTVCRRVTTYDSNHNENGRLIELVKEGSRTRAYLTTVLPGCHKGYHLHNKRVCNFVVLRGSVRFLMVKDGTRHQHDLSDAEPMRLQVPPGIFIGFRNLGSVEAWIFNYSDPPYDPAETGEQIDVPMTCSDDE